MSSWGPSLVSKASVRTDVLVVGTSSIPYQHSIPAGRRVRLTGANFYYRFFPEYVVDSDFESPHTWDFLNGVAFAEGAQIAKTNAHRYGERGWRIDSSAVNRGLVTLNKTAPIFGLADARLAAGVDLYELANRTIFVLPDLASDKLGVQFTHLTLLTIVAGVNDKLDFTEGVSGAKTATIAAGQYTRAALATEIQTKMNAVAVDNTYAVDFGVTVSGKFSIVRATGTATISLNWATGPNAATSIGTSIGFNVGADDTGLTTYTADNALAETVEYAVKRYTQAGAAEFLQGGGTWAAGAVWTAPTHSPTAAKVDRLFDSGAGMRHEVRFRGNGLTAGIAQVDRVFFYEVATVNVDPKVVAGSVELLTSRRMRFSAVADASDTEIYVEEFEI